MNRQSAQTIPRIVIVGGGTAGWMTAALLSHHLQSETCQIAIVAGDDTGIGVGEATIPSVVRLLKTLNADEAEFMRACDATWKLGIQFSDWVRPGHDNWHPFGVCGARIDGRDLFSYWLTDQSRPYHSYSLHWAASLAGKSPHSRASVSPLATTGAYAFHLNASKFAEWLRTRSLNSGVRRINGRVTDVHRNTDGSLSSVVLSDGETVAGDFFVDCSGFASILLRQAMQDPWIDWSRHLLCDRAVAVRHNAHPVVPPYTRSQAMSCGWSWQIPLMKHTGVGYVYSSSFLSAEDALRELRALTATKNDTGTDPVFVPMKVGRQTHFWKQNVLAIGLAAGFVEPLESSSLHLTQIGIERFVELLPTSDDSAGLCAEYNSLMTAVFDDVRDFVQLHYHLNQRDGDSFWAAARELPLSSGLQHRLQLYDETGLLDTLQPEAFPDTSYYHLLSGSGRLPRRTSALAMTVDGDRLQTVMQAIVEQNRRALRELPLHEEMLKQIHTPPLARAS